MILALGLVAFTACEDDNDSNPTLAQPTSFVLNEPTINGNIDLEKTATIALTWSQPTPYNDFNAPVVPTYWVEISPTGSFTKAFDANAEDNTGADFFTLDETYSNGKNVEVNAQSLNRSLEELCGWTETTTPALQQVSVRVKSALRDASFTEYGTIYSNVVTLNTIPYYVELKPADPEIWYLIGGDIGDGAWKSDMPTSSLPMQTLDGAEYDNKTGQGEISWTGYLAGNGFKLKKTLDSWDLQWGQGDAFGTFVENDGGSGNITVPAAGIYTVTLNTAKHELNVEKYEGSATVYDGMAISGSFNDWSDEPMSPVHTYAGAENHDWYITFTFDAGTEFKFKQAGSWDYNSGGTFISYAEGLYGYGVQGGANLYVSEPGTYIIIYNDITRYYRLIKQ